MDPVSAIGVAAAAVQFTELTFKITKRIAVFATLSFHKFKPDEVTTLDDCLSSLGSYGRELDELLGRYLPSSNASIPVKLVAALKTIAADIKIKSVVDRIKELHAVLDIFIITWAAFKDGVILDAQCTADIRNENDRQRSHHDTVYRVSRHEVRHFVERPLVLDEIDRLLHDTDARQPRTVILQGMGGQGKTQLALRYCANVRSRNIHDCIFWIDASTRASTIRGLEEVSEELNDSDQALLDSDARIAFVRRKLATNSSKWLLVFDNYDDSAAFDLRDYIPSGISGHVLITSRSTDTERIGPMIHISGMSEDEAIQLLFKQIDVLHDGTNHVAAAEIVKRLGYLPLAIDQAGAYMNAECLPLTNFLDHYEQSAREVLESVPSLWEYNEPATKDAKTVYTTWSLSFTLLKPNTPTGALKVTVLSLLAFFDEHEISEEIFEVYYSTDVSGRQLECMTLFTDEKQQWSGTKFDSVMREFLQLSLITSHDMKRKETKYSVVSLHPLVRDWVNLRQNIEAHRANFTIFTRLLAASLSVKFWEDSHLDHGFRMSSAARRRLERHAVLWMKTFKRHRPNLRPTVISSGRDGRFAAITAEQLLACFLGETGQVEGHYEISQWLWETCNTSDGQMVQIKFSAGCEEVLSLWSMRRSEEAKAKSQEKYQYWKAVLGDDDCSANNMLHISFLTFVCSLSRTPSMQDKRDTIALCQRELDRIPNDIQNLPKRQQLLIETLYAADRSKQKAVRDSILKIILDEVGVRWGKDYRKEIWSIDNWFDVTQICIGVSDDLDFMEQLTDAAVEWVLDKYGPDHIETLYLFNLRTKALLRMHRLTEAEAMARNIVKTVTGAWGARPSLYGHVYKTLGDVLYTQGRYEEAYKAYNSVPLDRRGPNSGIDNMTILSNCGRAAMKFNPALADAHFTLRYQLSKRIDDWDDIIRDVMCLYDARVRMGTEKAKRGALDVLIEGLEVYGLKIVYRLRNTPRKSLREIGATINLDDPISVPSSAIDECVLKLLLTRLGRYFGFELLIRIGMSLLETKSVNPAEQAYWLARISFEKGTNMTEHVITNFIQYAFDYTARHFELYGDKQRIHDTLEWAKLMICGKQEDEEDGGDEEHDGEDREKHAENDGRNAMVAS
ncbi:hypothetical protein GGR53DRAFT_466493 [Hypoxylon sp. FL1150]|nr:hypothetical protein GGR53DRAFT_466493 [Hypoxylon sp. FL1150]